MTLLAGLLSSIASLTPVSSASAAEGDPTGCGYASGSTGKYAETICWIDFSSYNQARAATPNGQDFTVQIGGGYTASFTLTTKAVSGRPFFATTSNSTAQMAYYSAFAKTYYGSAPGKPILWNIGNFPLGGAASGVTWRLGDITVKAPDGSAVQDYRFVSGDAESTAPGEKVTFRSDQKLELLESLRTTNSGCLAENATGVGTTQVTCEGVGIPGPQVGGHSNLLYASQSPTFIEQTIDSSSRNAGVFGLMMSKVQLNKVVKSRVGTSDAFQLNVSSGSATLATASTGTNNSASTGPVTVLASSTVGLAESGEGSTNLAGYDTTWVCEVNGVPNAAITPDDGETGLVISPTDTDTGDFVDCTVTNAAPVIPIPCSVSTAYLSQGSPNTRLYAQEFGSGAITFTPIGASAGFRYNAMALNPVDGHLYAIRTSNNHVYRIHPSTGATTDLGATAPALGGATQYLMGAFDPAGNYYVPGGGSKTLYKINVDTMVSTATALSASVNSGDFTWAGGYLWSGSGQSLTPDVPSGKMIRTDPTTGQVTYFNAPAELPSTAGHSFGAAFTYGNGNIALGDNLGTLFQVSIAAPGSANPTFTVVSSQTSPASDVNDGAACSSPPTDLEIVKTGPAEVEPNGDIEWKLTVKNNGPSTSSGYTVKDAVPAGYTDISATPGCDIDGNDITCTGGELAAGDTAVITVKATAPAANGCLTNQSSVLGNEAEPAGTTAEENNESELQTCVGAPGLTVEKTSNATANTRIGDTVTYTVKATNTGSMNYTMFAPAMLVDDLTEVLDDGTLDEDSITADRGVASYGAPKITWTGALAVDESVTLTYEVKLKAGGDRQVHNVVFGPDCGLGDPDCIDPPTPRCDEAEGPCVETKFDLPSLSITKTADRSDLPATGGEVTYTVKLKNEGPGNYTIAAPATFEDDLSDVLDDATLDEADIDASIGTATFADPDLSWTGVLTAGQVATITYTVTYTGAGDQVLNNLACIPADEALDADDLCRTVTIPGSGLRQTKTVNPPSGTPVTDGQEVTYTLTFENIGGAAADVDTTDDLSGVVDDAALDPADIDADAGLTATLNGAGDAIAITGSVPVGEALTVSYTVTVNAFADQADHVLGNVLACQPGDQPDCDPITTENRIPHLTVAKTSDATAASRPGDVITYTVKATNDGAGDYTTARPAVVLDDLTGVLDDGTVDTDSIDADRVPDPTYAAPRINWTGTLPAGESVTLTYEVTLKAGGDGQVRNVAFVPGCVPGVAGCTPPPSPLVCVDNIDPVTGLPCDEVNFGLPKLSVTKSSDQATVSSVGDKVEYAVTVKNEGPGDYTAADPATFTDDLSKVLDDATLDDADLDASSGVATLAGTSLFWTGALAAGDSATVTYTVSYTGAGDMTMTNVACVLATEAVDPTDPCDTVTVEGPGLVQTKTANPGTGTTVQVGQEVTYTLTFKNTGMVSALVDTSDDLSGVIDDADLIDGPDVDAPLTATLNGAGDQIKIGGAVGVGQTRTVSYTVKVLPFADQADHILGNVLACQTGSHPDCEPPTTVHPIRNLNLVKTSDATAASRPGDVITYTVKATNTGEGDYTTAEPAVMIDDLTGVADDGTLDQDSIEADRGDDPTYVEPRITWTGALPAGESVTLTYEVKLKGGGDGQVRNVVFVPDCVPGASGCHPPTPECEDNVDPVTGLACDKVTFELPKLSISKAANRTELPAVGESVEYTVTIKNEGPGDYTAADPATFTDDLSKVLDDATLDEGDIAASVGTVSLAGTTLSWSGVLAAYESATITYSVVYSGEGNLQLRNLACIPVDEAQDPSDPCRVVTIPGSGLRQTKTVNPRSGSAVDPGQDITYTLSFENVGGAPATVDTSDDLSGVLDDAELTDGPDAETGLDAVLNGAGDKILITGSVPVGEKSTVTYTVKVKAFDDQVDHVLRNVLACQPNDPDDCEPPTTVNWVRHLTLTKVSDAAQGVNTGDEVTYTLVVTNDGEEDYTALKPGMFTDDLSGVLDDATYNDDVSATAGAVDYDAPILTWTGPLAKGASATITYTVKVTNAGDHELRNTAWVPGCTDDGCTPPPVVTPLPHIVAAKVSDPGSGETVKAGQVVTYTLSWTNDGEATGPVDSTDDLVQVLDDAEVTSEPVSDYAGVTATRTGDKLRVVGELAAGDTVEVTYEVTIKADGKRGDNIARNVLTPDVPQVECDDDGDCTVPPPPSTEHPVGELEDWKSVDPASGSTVAPGQQVTYTLHFTNTGEAPVEVDRDDVLTQVLDDAKLVSQPKASSDALDASKVTDDRFNVHGALKPGETVTVSYVVQVRADGDRGDDQLGNFLVDQGTKPPGECEPVDDQRADCTSNPVSEVTVVKSSDPKSGDQVKDGQNVTYTLTFTNVSKNAKAGPVDIDYTDHMDGVLDDADLTKGPQASDAVLTATTVKGDKIRIVGSMESGQVVTVTYTVKVKAYDKQGDHALDNVVATTGQPPVCAPGSRLCTAHEITTVPPDNPWLPDTGNPVSLGLIGMALLSLFGGGALVLVGRRRREDPTDRRITS